MKKIISIYLLKGLMVFIALFVWSCEKFVVIDPPITSLTGNVVFEDEETATAAILNVYHDISRTSTRPFQGEQSLSWMSGLLADEYNSYFNDNRAEFANHQITPQNLIVQRNWAALYEDIYRVNIIIEQISKSEKLSQPFRKGLEGEARFVRALMYFYLVNFWDNVPLVLTTDYFQNKTLPQSDQEVVYAQIIEDLIIAKEMLSLHLPTDRKTRPNQYAVNALLAKVYLSLGQWNDAIEATSAILNMGQYQLENDLNHVFLSNSKEVIFQIEPIYPNVYTWDAFHFVLTSTPTRVTLSDSLTGSFFNGDLRKSRWIGEITINNKNYYFPNKYKVKMIPDYPSLPSESLVMFRLAEQYLIRAECRARIGDLVGASADLNKIRNRAGLESVGSEGSEKLIEMILKERQLELFTEGCNRWFDLKRSGITRTTVLPIPEIELLYNPALVQNSGY